MMLLEREATLAQLQTQWSSACSDGGRLAFVEGEAGIGKTSVLRAFARQLQHEAPVYWGACEAMLTPRPLGPLEDIAQQPGGGPTAPLATLLAEGAPRHRLFVAFIDLLAQRPALAVLEDLHWADEATLDLLRFAGRRIARTHALLVASFRSDELVPLHPLRAALGDLATTGAQRLTLPALSLAAVRSLCGEARLDAADLHRKTAGNPFFVTEVLATDAQGTPGVPATVQDAVLARSARLSPSARAVLDAAAVAGPRVEPWLLQELTAAESTAIDECLATGVLRADVQVFSFRHELARQVMLQAMTPTRAASLHRLVLQSLRWHPSTGNDAARLALHADGADDADAVRHWAPLAARQAAARGAHRLAAVHWLSMLSRARNAAEQAEALDQFAVAAHWSGQMEKAIAARRDAARHWLEARQSGHAAASLADLSTLCVLSGRRTEAQAAVHEAQTLLPPGTSTAAAFAVQGAAAWLHMLDGDFAETLAIAEPTLAAARRSGDRETMVQCLRTIGAALLATGRIEQGVESLERGFALAQQLLDDGSAAQMFANLGTGCANAMRLTQATEYLHRGIAFCSERDLDAPRLFQTATLAHVQLMRGEWNAADRSVQQVIAEPRATVIARIAALSVLGRLRARRGDPGVWPALDEARDLAAGAGLLRQQAPARSRIEAAWLEGRHDDAVHEAAAFLPLAIAKQHAGFAAELLLLSRRSGADVGIPGFCAAHPCALEATGRWQQAADAWRDAGCPFETARALAEGDENAQREALALFEALGACPMVERVRLRLRAAGVRGLPRGPRSTTRQLPAGLTSKEFAVLVLLAAGLRNKEIAERLSRSARTIDHHLAAIFAKLQVNSRAEAVSAAYRLGIVAADAHLKTE